MSQLSLYGVGDVLFYRDNPESSFALALPTLKKADILFGQLENVFSDKAPDFHGASSLPAPTQKVSCLTSAGFQVMSLASNHTLDFGEGCLLDSIETLKRSGIAAIGAGKNIEEARRPAIVERNGTRIGFLGYCTVLPRGYEAKAGKAGAAPMRAITSYEQVDWQPGMPPRVLSFAHQEDLAALLADIKTLRPTVDVLVLSLHWGVHYIPSIIAMHQKEIAYAAIDAGVDVILGHHAHILKGIEVYKGKVIFYSLGNFVTDSRPIELLRRDTLWNLLRWDLDPGPPPYAFPRDSRKAIIGKCLISEKTISRVSYIPVIANKELQAEVLPQSDPRSAQHFDYMQWICKDQQLDTRLTWEADEVVIQA
ncbi:MAG: CapA family protein [Chloroflexi bacterium]|nr:CapA family protein [Chloroflexota bacterium]